MIRAITVSAICVVCSLTEAFCQESGGERSSLEGVRQASLESFTLEVEVDRPVNAFVSGQGRSTRLLRVTVGKDVTAMVWKATQLPTAKYFPPGIGGYQTAEFKDGNLLVVMASEGAWIRDAETNEEYRERIGFRVAPDGSVTQSGPSPFLVRHRPSSMKTESLGLLDRILWALGRPWGDGFGDVISDEEEPNGTRRVRTTTDGWSVFSAPGFERACELVIAPGDGFLVRHADFARGVECQSEGTRWFGNVALAERGEFTVGEAETTITVRLVSFSPAFDADLVDEARKMLSRARSRQVLVMDEREDDPDQRLRLVPAGELDKPDPVRP